MCFAVILLVRWGMDTAAATWVVWLPASSWQLPSSSISWLICSLPRFELLQQFQFIAEESYFHLCMPRSVGDCCRSLEVFQPLLDSYFAYFLFLQDNFLSVSDKCSVFQCLESCTGRARFMLDPWHQSDCVGISLLFACLRCGMVFLYHIQEMHLWSWLLSLFLSFLVSLFFSSVVNITVYPVKIAIYFETDCVLTKISILESWWLLCADCSLLPSNRANLCCRVRIPVFVNHLQQVALIYFL